MKFLKFNFDAAVKGALYNLIVHLTPGREIRVGRLDLFFFPQGYYVYTGSARNNLKARLARHQRREKRKRWHIDYLLEFGEVIGIKIYTAEERGECELNRKIERMKGGQVLFPRFGSSDCRCLSHLVYFKKRPQLPS